MGTTYRCTSIKEFNTMFKCIKADMLSDVDRIYNIGSHQYPEYPLFVCTNRQVFRIFFSDNELLLEVYSNEDFEKMMEKDIVRYSDDPTDFDYIWPEAFIPNSIISNIVPLRGCGTISNLEGIDFHFFNGTKLCIRSSDLVLGTMSSWIEE